MNCPCGAVILDIADSSTNKAHLIPDEGWLALLEKIDGLIEGVAARPAKAEAACMEVRRLLKTRPVYQCRECGRLFVDDRAHQSHIFTPEPGRMDEADEAGRGIFGK